MDTAQQFFYDHAGFSYDPKSETKEQGRWNNAVSLALVEQIAHRQGYYAEWYVGPEIDSSEFRDDVEPYALWECAVYQKTDPMDPDGSGEVVMASLGGVDFGPGGEPWGQPYKRVVEAELFYEALNL